MDPTQYQSIMQIYNPSDSTDSMNYGGTNGTTQPAATQSKGNWFTHLLPTVGSIAVPLLGTALAPVTGGASLLAAAGLSGLGAAGGKMLQNSLEGNSVGKDVGTAGAEGAIGGLVGGVAGKALGKGAELLTGKAGSMAAKAAEQDAAQSAMKAMSTTYKDVSPQLQKAWNAADSLTHTGNMGFDVTNPSNLVKLSNTSNDVLNDVLNGALSKSGAIDMSGYSGIVKNSLARPEVSGVLGSYEPIAVSKGKLGPNPSAAGKLLQQLETVGQNFSGKTTDPTELRTLITQLGNMAEDAKPTLSTSGVIDPEKRAIYNVINDVRSQVKNALYNRPELNDIIKASTGNLTAGDVGTQQLADHLNNIITQAGTKEGQLGAQDLLDEISRNINIGNLGKAGQDVGQIVTSTGAKGRALMAAGIEDAPNGAGFDSAGNLINMMPSGNGTILTKAIEGGIKASKNPAILTTLGRISDMGSKLAPYAGAAAATAPNLAADPVAPIGANAGIENEPGGTMGAMTGAQGNNLSTILDQYMAMGTVDPYLLSSTTPLVSSLAPTVQQQHLAATSLSANPALYANAGGAQGMSGILSRISGLIPGTAANTYKNNSSAAAAQLAAVLGISPQAAAGLLPQLMQNQNTAGISSGILGGLTGQLAY